jgi:uncharacterized protein
MAHGEMELIGVALLTGAVGSLHCAVMCGPLAAAGSAGGRGLAYFGGRLLSYAAVGALLGTIGGHALCDLPVGAVQLGAAGLVAAFAGWQVRVTLRAPAPARPLTIGRRRRPLLARALAVLPRRGLALGLATGVLPCATLVPAWTLAMGAGGAAGGIAVMAAFFVGTAPGLLAPILAGRLARERFAAVPRGVKAAAWALLAMWIVARPLLGALHHH